ncbi:MAG: hypothetical protein J5I81_00595 [Nitrococcus mobilis]|nr:hypothetical protein [Nitrococcus mobilis]
MNKPWCTPDGRGRQRRSEITHLIAGRLEDHCHLLGELMTRNRDFQ